MHCGRLVSYWQTCYKVKDNEENCVKARQRMSVLLPLLSKIYQRVSLDPKLMCPAIQHAVMGIAEELNVQVSSDHAADVPSGCSLPMLSVDCLHLDPF